MRTGLITVLGVLASACQGIEAIPGTQVKMDFTRAAGLYEAPFPSDDLVRPDGTIALTAFPNPNKVDLVGQGLNLLGKEARGFSTSGGVFFQLSAPLGAKLPTLAQSVEPGAQVFLARCGNGEFQRVPVDVAFHTDGGPFGSPNLLSLLPLQGKPLLPHAVYCAVVLRGALDTEGRALGVSQPLRQLIAGLQPEGMGAAAFRTYQKALAVLLRFGPPQRELAGLSVFTTDDPTFAFAKVAQAMLARPLPVPGPLELTDVFPDYCVYATTVSMPDFQSGTPPYEKTGGRWLFDKEGNPQLQNEKLASLFVTLPRVPRPLAGFPVVVFVRAGGGGDRPLVDRGVQPTTGARALVPGSGPAQEFARAGFAGVSVDGPLGGLRNVTGGDEQVLVYNFFNAGALRDNIRESAAELVLLAHVIEALSFEARSCPGVGSLASFDTSRMALMGHSTGASIAPLALAYEPMFRAGLLSGAGGSFIENVLYKQKPFEVRPLAEVLIGYSGEGRALVAEDPVLTLVQWAAEPADPQVYARRIIEAPLPGQSPRHVLMMQGIVDHYILPRIANAISLPLGLDLGGEERDLVERTLLPDETPLGSLLRWSGRGSIALPAAGNRDGVTAVVTQNAEDGLEDGHEVVFQTEAPKRQYRCFLESFAKGTPRVPAPGTSSGCE